MEENENLDGVQTEEQTEEATTESGAQEDGLSREEILAASRKENKSFDEREQQDFIKAESLAMSVGFLIAGIVIIVTAIVKDVVPIEIILIMCGMQATQSLIIGLRTRRMKKLYLTVGIIEAICAVILLVVWILQLCGVM